MSIGSRIKELRENKNISRNDFATMIGVTVGAISNYENDVSSPKEPILFKIIETLECEPNYIFQDMVKIKNKKNDVTIAEYEHVKKYRFISKRSPDGAKMVDSILNREYSLAKQISDQQNRIQELETENQEISEKITLLRIYTYFGRIACAGESFDFSEIPDETIEAPYMEGADFIIGVNGDSMEPDYHDGDRLYVKKTDRMTYGDVGIFTINNECFLKEYGKDGLISRNKDYNNMAGTEDVQLIGKVIGKV